MKTYPAVRMSEQGDQIDLQTYSDWCLQSPATTHAQIFSGSLLVQPFTLKPRPRWRRDDCLAKLNQRDLVVQQRKARAKKHLGLVKAS